MNITGYYRPRFHICNAGSRYSQNVSVKGSGLGSPSTMSGGKRGVEMRVFMEDCKLWGVYGWVDRCCGPTLIEVLIGSRCWLYNINNQPL